MSIGILGFFNIFRGFIFRCVCFNVPARKQPVNISACRFLLALCLAIAICLLFIMILICQLYKQANPYRAKRTHCNYYFHCFLQNYRQHSVILFQLNRLNWLALCRYYLHGLEVVRSFPVNQPPTEYQASLGRRRRTDSTTRPNGLGRYNLNET